MPDNAASTGNIEMQSGETNIAGRDISKGDGGLSELLRYTIDTHSRVAIIESQIKELLPIMKEIRDLKDDQRRQWGAIIVVGIVGALAFIGVVGVIWFLLVLIGGLP